MNAYVFVASRMGNWQYYFLLWMKFVGKQIDVYFYRVCSIFMGLCVFITYFWNTLVLHVNRDWAPEYCVISLLSKFVQVHVLVTTWTLKWSELILLLWCTYIFNFNLKGSLKISLHCYFYRKFYKSEGKNSDQRVQ